MHTRHTSRDQQCGNTYTSAQDQLCNSVVQYADHRLPTLKCCIFSTTHNDVFIDTNERETSICLNGFVCLYIEGWCNPVDGMRMLVVTNTRQIIGAMEMVSHNEESPCHCSFRNFHSDSPITLHIHSPTPYPSSSTYIFILIFPFRLKMHAYLSTHLPLCIPTDLPENESYICPPWCFTSS